MYGRRVHEAVIAAGERTSAITIHLADEEYDHGPVLAQLEVPVEIWDTAETFASRMEAWNLRSSSRHCAASVMES